MLPFLIVQFMLIGKTQPMQKVMPAEADYTELGGTDDDYFTWIFSYTEKSH